jgi:hypothetical protein
MRLSYLGVNCEDTPSMLEVTEGEIGRMYCGQNRQFRYPRHIPEPPRLNNRQYCGITHSTPQSVCAIPARSTNHNTREVLDGMMSSHQRTIQSSLGHRLQVARAKGDQSLVRLLEAEFRTDDADFSIAF